MTITEIIKEEKNGEELAKELMSHIQERVNEFIKESPEQKIWREHYEKLKTEKCYHCHEKSAGYEDIIFCQNCLKMFQVEAKKDYEKHFGKLIRKANKEARMKAKGTWKNNENYNKEIGVIQKIDPIVKIRGKKIKTVRINGQKVEKIIGGFPIKYSELTQEEQKEYRENLERERKAREDAIKKRREIIE